MAIDRDGIEVIRNASFPSAWGWRGYDRVEVEKFLDELADWLEDQGEAPARRRTNGRASAKIVAELEAKIDALEHEATKAKRRERRLLQELKLAREKLKGRGARKASTGARAKAGKTTGSTRAVRKRTGKSTGSQRAVRRTKGTESRTSAAESGPREGAFDVNKVDFEELREMGLSITHSALLIALRDTRGGFKSLDELEDVQGLSKAAVEKLRANLYVGSTRRSR